MEIKSVCFWLVYWLFSATRKLVDVSITTLLSVFIFTLHLLYPPKMTEHIEEIASLHRRISTFETKHLDHEINELRSMLHTLTEKEANTNRLLIEERNRADNQKIDKEDALRQLDNARLELKKEIEEQLASQQSVIEMLSNDNSKLKQQKAQVRCDYLKTRNELTSVRRELEFLKKSYEEAEKTENQLRSEMSIEKTLRKQAIDDMEKFRDAERAKMAQETAAEAKAELEKMREMYERECEKVAKLKTFVCEQEKQCDELANHIKTLTKERDSWSEKAEQRASEIQELRQKTTNTESKLCETNRLRDELNRYKDKTAFLERQIKTLHVEYRQELAELTKKLGTVQHEGYQSSTAKTQSMVQRFERTRSHQEHQLNRSVSFADNRIKQLESELQTERKLLAEREAEIQELQRQIDEIEHNEDQLIDDKTRALNALNEAVQKLENKHDEYKKLQSIQDEMSKELQRAYDQIADLEDISRDVEAKLRKKDEDITYWRRLYERRTNPSDIDSQSEVVSEVVDRFQFEFDDMEEDENRAPRKKVRYDDQGPSVVSKSPQTPRLGMMRHEIEHRFKNIWMLLKQKSVACARCGEILPSMKTAAKCQGKFNFATFKAIAIFMLTFHVHVVLEKLAASLQIMLNSTSMLLPNSDDKNDWF
ncbi:hypothetical protein M3Y97_00188200 [Aphelenchoides bicaudatus]|nr:hypothetical protein M3Y97_00188200 [Aphelenchoides bicaudatus]